MEVALRAATAMHRSRTAESTGADTGRIGRRRIVRRSVGRGAAEARARRRTVIGTAALVVGRRRRSIVIDMMNRSAATVHIAEHIAQHQGNVDVRTVAGMLRLTLTGTILRFTGVLRGIGNLFGVRAEILFALVHRIRWVGDTGFQSVGIVGITGQNIGRRLGRTSRHHEGG